MTINTIEEIYAAINPLPALLCAKGKKTPSVSFDVEANAGMKVCLQWIKYGSDRDWDRDYELFTGATASEVIAKARAFVEALPDAKTANLHRFMDKLGKLIDTGREHGIEVDYLNPLTDTMKRLSENIITYKPEAA